MKSHATENCYKRIGYPLAKSHGEGNNLEGQKNSLAQSEGEKVQVIVVAREGNSHQLLIMLMFHYYPKALEKVIAKDKDSFTMLFLMNKINRF